MMRQFGLAVVALGLAFGPALAGAAPSPAVQQEFSAFLTKFRAALKAGDKAALAALTVPQPDADLLGSARKKSACLMREKAVYDRNPKGEDTYTLFCGETLFGFTRTPSGFRYTDVGAND